MDKKEYIERDKLRELILEDIELCGESDINRSPIAYGTKLGFRGALSYVETLPAADVVAVRHGEWRYGDKYKTCSLCGATTLMYSSGTAYWNYCPNCGADMRGESNGNE